MDALCPHIDTLVLCYVCGRQSLPPYKLCEGVHTVCPPCVKYLPRCVCGQDFVPGPHLVFDSLISAMKLKCKYATLSDGERDDEGKRGGCPPGRWYNLPDLREHYRTGCPGNAFTCPMTGCGNVARVDTVAEHYERVHGPFGELTSDDPRDRYRVCFKIRMPP